MSALYDRVVKALQAGAERQQQIRDAPRDNEGCGQWLVMHPSDWASIANELGTKAEIHALQTPGTWLLGVDIALDEDAHLGSVTLRTEEHY